MRASFLLLVLLIASSECVIVGLQSKCANFFCSEADVNIMAWDPKNVESSAQILAPLLTKAKTSELYNTVFEAGFEGSFGQYNVLIIPAKAKTVTWATFTIASRALTTTTIPSFTYNTLHWQVGRWIGTTESNSFHLTKAGVTPGPQLYPASAGLVNTGVATYDRVANMHYLAVVNNNPPGQPGEPMVYLHTWNVTSGAMAISKQGFAYDSGGSTGGFPVYMVRDNFNGQLLGVVGTLLGHEMGDLNVATYNVTSIWDFRPFVTMATPNCNGNCRVYDVSDNTFFQLANDNTNNNLPNMVGCVRSNCAPGSIHCNQQIWSPFTSLANEPNVFFAGFVFVSRV